MEIGIGVIAALVIAALLFALIRPRPLTALLFAPFWLPFLAVVVVAVAIGVDFLLDHKDRKHFNDISMTDTQVIVEKVFGKPGSIQPCGDNLWWGSDKNYIGKNDGRCVKWVRYNHFLSAWAIGYSAEGKVVSKYHYFSE